MVKRNENGVGSEENPAPPSHFEALDVEELSLGADDVITVAPTDDFATVLGNATQGDTIFLLPGTHESDKVVSFVSDITITGTHGSILLLPAQSLPTETHVLQLAGANVTVKNITIDGNRAAHTGTETTQHEGLDANGDGFTAENIVVKDSPGDGIDIDGSGEVSIINCKVDNCGGFGIHVSSSTTTTTVSGNHVTNCGQTHSRGGIDLFDTSSDSTYSSNTIESCYHGMRVSGTGASVVGNVIINNDKFGIYVSGGSGHTAASNRCDNNDRGIVVDPSLSDVTVSDNTTNALTDGILLRSNDSTVSSNIANGADRGIYILGGAITSGVSVVGNTVSSGGSNGGIVLSDVESSTVSGNTVRGVTGTEINEASSSDHNVIDGNVVEGTISTVGTNSVLGDNIQR